MKHRIPVPPIDPQAPFTSDDAPGQRGPSQSPPSPGFPPEVPRHPPHEKPEWNPRNPREYPPPQPSPGPDWSPSSESNPETPTRATREMEAWQKKSEAKFPPGVKPPRIHELPHLAASNEAAAAPTVVEEITPPTPQRDGHSVGDEAPPEERAKSESPAPFIKKTALERLENEGGNTDVEVSEDAGENRHPRRGYVIVT